MLFCLCWDILDASIRVFANPGISRKFGEKSGNNILPENIREKLENLTNSRVNQGNIQGQSGKYPGNLLSLFLQYVDSLFSFILKYYEMLVCFSMTKLT